MSDLDTEYDTDVYVRLSMDYTDMLQHDEGICQAIKTEPPDDISADALEEHFEMVELKLEAPDDEQYITPSSAELLGTLKATRPRSRRVKKQGQQGQQTMKPYKIVADMGPEELQRKRERDLERVRRRRAQMTPEELERRRAADRERKRRRRERMTGKQLEDGARGGQQVYCDFNAGSFLPSTSNSSDFSAEGPLTRDEQQAFDAELEMCGELAAHSLMPATSNVSNLSPDEQLQRRRAVDAERKRIRLGAMTPEQYQQVTADGRQGSVKSPRSAMFNTSELTPAEQLKRHRAIDAERKRQRLAAMTPEQYQQYRAAQTESARRRKLKRLATLSDEELERRRAVSAEQNRLSYILRQATMSAEEQERIRERRRQRYINIVSTQLSGEPSAIEKQRHSTAVFLKNLQENLQLTFVTDINEANSLSLDGKNVFISSFDDTEESNSFQCHYCEVTFHNYDIRERHISIYHPGRRPPAGRPRRDAVKYSSCFICRAEFSTNIELLQHMSDVHHEVGWQLYICGICQKVYDRGVTFKSHHFRSHGASKSSQHLCNVCGKLVIGRCMLQLHMRTHSDLRPYQCELCGREFKYHSTHAAHMTSVHSDQKFRCDVCNKLFMRQDTLNRHRHLMHDQDKVHRCDLCDKTFTHAVGLKRHENLHTGNKPWKCRVCEKRFPNQLARYKHEWQHGDVFAKFSCPDCGQVFRENVGLKNHVLRKHTGGSREDNKQSKHKKRQPFRGHKMYTCSICDRAYTWKRDLVRHFLKHTSSTIKNEPNHSVMSDFSADQLE